MEIEPSSSHGLAVPFSQPTAVDECVNFYEPMKMRGKSREDWFYWVLLGFTYFYWVLPSFTGFYLVLLGFT